MVTIYMIRGFIGHVTIMYTRIGVTFIFARVRGVTRDHILINYSEKRRIGSTYMMRFRGIFMGLFQGIVNGRAMYTFGLLFVFNGGVVIGGFISGGEGKKSGHFIFFKGFHCIFRGVKRLTYGTRNSCGITRFNFGVKGLLRHRVIRFLPARGVVAYGGNEHFSSMSIGYNGGLIHAIARSMGRGELFTVFRSFPCKCFIFWGFNCVGRGSAPVDMCTLWLFM